MHKYTLIHTCTHSCADTHLGLMPIFHHNGLHDILFPKNRSCVPCFYPKLSNFILSYLALLSQAGVLLGNSGYIYPLKAVLEEPGWRRPSPLGMESSTASPGGSWYLEPPYTRSYTLPSLLPQSQYLGHPTFLLFGVYICLPEFPRGLYRGSSMDIMTSLGLSFSGSSFYSPFDFYTPSQPFP